MSEFQLDQPGVEQVLGNVVLPDLGVAALQIVEAEDEEVEDLLELVLAEDFLHEVLGRLVDPQVPVVVAALRGDGIWR